MFAPRQMVAVAITAIVACVTVVLLLGGAAAVADSSVQGGRCKAGTTAARIAGRQVCLRAGQRCTKTLDRQYHRYGFHCHTGKLTRSKPKPPPPRDVSLVVTGEPEVIFDWTTDRCDDADIPDLPARVFRDADGNVQLISTHYVNRRFIGADLDRIRRDCGVIMESGLDPDPAAYDDHEWIASTWTPDGSTVYALVHNEYQGHSHPGRCPSGDYFKCWYNAITLAVSRDAGRTYGDAPRPKLVATIPYRYESDQGPMGMFTPSNIVHNARDGFFYALVYRNIRNTTIGNCLIRTRNLSDSNSWRAWSGGTAFATTFIDPYGTNPTPDEHLCAPVSRSDPQDFQPHSLTWNTVARQWLLVGQAVEGAYYALSPDLINWTRPQLFLPAQVTWDYKCGDADPIAYPTLIDPRSVSRNFDTSGATAYVYYTQFHYDGCQQTLDRDLVRVPIQIRP